ncbi:hypothetical protein [Actinomadura litoris]|uniref:hypothetical protein n=1 Tax=Actinomadura litoris TaxID=2678616 RepID=UPI001FA6C458|nr:hypothetical protein [Actinomadura litoris]
MGALLTIGFQKRHAIGAERRRHDRSAGTDLIEVLRELRGLSDWPATDPELDSWIAQRTELLEKLETLGDQLTSHRLRRRLAQAGEAMVLWYAKDLERSLGLSEHEVRNVMARDAERALAVWLRGDSCPPRAPQAEYIAGALAVLVQQFDQRLESIRRDCEHIALGSSPRRRNRQHTLTE